LTIDPSKIKNEVNCRAFNNILIYLEENFGEERLRELIEKTGMTVPYLRDQNNWVSWSYYCVLLEELATWTGDPGAPFKAGTYSGHKRAWGYLHYVFYAFGNVGRVLKKASEIVPHFNRGAEWTLLDLQKNRATIRIRMKEGYPARRVCCESRMGQAVGIPKAFGMPPGRARETQCQAQGADACVMEVAWLNRPQKLYGIVGLLLGLLASTVFHLAAPDHPGNFLAAALIALTGYLTGRHLDHRRSEAGNAQINAEQTAALEESVKIIENKYDELKCANDGLFALHEISRAITSTLQLDEVLKKVLQMAVERLGFDRAVVMLVDEKEGVLREGRIYGDEALVDYVRELQIRISPRSPVAEEVLYRKRGQIVTQEYITSESATPLEKQIFQITQTPEYVVAPIVSRDRLLGILAADRARSGASIKEQDRDLMVSLANQVAVAIENARAFLTIEDLNVNLERKITERTQALETSLVELTEAQEQLIHTEKMSSLGLLMSGLAHEINNPINFAHNGLQAMQQTLRKIQAISRSTVKLSDLETRDRAGKVELEEALTDSKRIMEIIQTGLNRTRDLVASLKHFSRREGRDQEYFALESSLQSALTILRHQMAERIVVQMDIGVSARILGHPDQLSQAFLNLIHNAIQAISEKGHVRIMVDPTESGHVRVLIRDDGQGIAPADLPRIFEPFFTTKKSGEGTGLGMSICRRIIENHGGTIQVSSRLGQGTDVTVQLPVSRERQARDEGVPREKSIGAD
jgi:signal transduction histidine kinase